MGAELQRTQKSLGDFREQFFDVSAMLPGSKEKMAWNCHSLVDWVADFFARFDQTYMNFQAGKRIAWPRAFKWSLLPKMRRILDALPLTPAPVAPKFTANECRLLRIYELALQFRNAKGKFRCAAIRDEWNRENPEDSLGEKKHGGDKAASVIRAAERLLKKHGLSLQAALARCPAVPPTPPEDN